MIAARQRVPPRPPDGSAATALLALLAVALGLWAFAALTDEVLEGETHAFDEAVLLALRSAGDPDDPLGPAWLERSLEDVTALGGYPVVALIAVIAAGYLLVRRLWAGTLLVPAVVVLGALGNELMKRAFGRPRPDLVAHGVDVATLSYPSGHAMLSAVVYLTLAVLLAEAQASRIARVYIVGVALLLALLVGASRVYLGVHWPTDVLAGWSAGAAIALSVWLLRRRGPWLWRTLRRRSAAQHEPGAEPAGEAARAAPGDQP